MSFITEMFMVAAIVTITGAVICCFATMKSQSKQMDSLFGMITILKKRIDILEKQNP
jgi:hypothetical protein